MPLASTLKLLQGKLASAFPATTSIAVPEVFTPASLFAAGEQGAWFDSTDITTMFEDTAGTVAVHTPGNGVADSPVAKWLDKSGRGNHAVAPNSSEAPTLSARYNLLQYTEQFDNAYWLFVDASAVANQTTAPDGTTTADFLRESATTNRHVLYYGVTNPNSGTANYTLSVCVKAGTRQYFGLQIGGSLSYIAYWDLSTGTLTTTRSSGVTTNTSNSITSLGNGWYRCTVSSDCPGGGTVYAVAALSDVAVPTSVVFDCASYTGNGTSGLYIWGIDLRATNDGVGLPVYQKVADVNTYTSTGFPYYLLGTVFGRKSLSTGNINLTSTNKISTWSSLRKFTDTTSNGTSVIYEFSAAADLNNGAFALYTPAYNNIANSAAFNVRGTTLSSLVSSYTTPSSKVVTGTADISTNTTVLRMNGAQVGTSTSSLGGGNFGLYTLNLFARGGSFQFNGRVYSVIVRGAASTATEISNTEAWLNGVAKFY